MSTPAWGSSWSGAWGRSWGQAAPAPSGAGAAWLWLERQERPRRYQLRGRVCLTVRCRATVSLSEPAAVPATAAPPIPEVRWPGPDLIEVLPAAARMPPPAARPQPTRQATAALVRLRVRWTAPITWRDRLAEIRAAEDESLATWGTVEHAHV
jgi:hypothetical protein